jgi:hypothetical protein
MVSLPEGYMLVERSIWTERQVEAATACITRLKGVHGMRDRDLAMAAIDAAQCTAPDIALADLLPVQQHHPEPIAWMVGTAIWWTKEEAERDAAAMGLPVVGLGPMTGSAPAEQHQGEPVAYAVFTDNGNIRIWSTNCAAVAIKVMQEEGKQVVPLYAHSAPSATAEVERLRTELDLRTQEREKFLGWCRDARAESTKLRAQLAERDALLQEIRRKPGLFSGDFILRLDETLSASAEPRPFRTPDCPDCACVQDGQCLCSPSKPSAEPSAPVEIDERPEGCCCPPKGYNGLWAAGPCPVHQGLRKLEQARTALARKPS